MPHLNPTWQTAFATAALLVVLTAVLRWRGRPRLGAAAQEAAVVAVLFAAWQWIGSITHGAVAGAQEHALAIWHAQQALGLPSELTVQQAILPHPWLVQAANAYYLYGHLNPIVVLLAWIWWRHRDQYARVRLLLCLLTAVAFVAHLVPVAPPRLVPQLGFVDVARVYGQSVYGDFGAGIPGQLLAMPSLHVGWAVLLAFVVVTTARSRWRWLAVAHRVLMTLVVVATANHWWADAAAGALLVAGCVGLDRAVRARLAGRSRAAGSAVAVRSAQPAPPDEDPPTPPRSVSSTYSAGSLVAGVGCSCRSCGSMQMSCPCAPGAGELEVSGVEVAG